jgi:hypothetical protein
MHEKIPQMHQLMRLWYFFVQFFLAEMAAHLRSAELWMGKKRRGCANFDTASWVFLRLEVTKQPLVFVTNY